MELRTSSRTLCAGILRCVRRSERTPPESLLEAGDYSGAIAGFREQLTHSPHDPRLRGRLAEAYRLSGNRERAFYHFDQAARSLSAMGRQNFAANYLEQADALMPGEPEVLFRLAQCYESLGQTDALIDVCERLQHCARAVGDRRRQWALERLVHYQPEDINTTQELIELLIRSDRITKAAEMYRLLVERSVRSGHSLQALAQDLEGRLTTHPALRVPRALIALYTESPQLALQWLSPIAQTEDPLTLEALAQCYSTLGDHEQLIRVQLARSNLLLTQNRAAEAKALLEPLLSRFEHPTLYEAGAQIAIALGDSKQAGAFWGRAILIRHRNGDTQACERTLVAFLRSTPNSPEGLHVAARVLRETGRIPQAETLERRIRAILNADDHQTPTQGLTHPIPETRERRRSRLHSLRPSKAPQTQQYDESPEEELPTQVKATIHRYGRGLVFGPPKSKAPNPRPLENMAEEEVPIATSDISVSGGGIDLTEDTARIALPPENFH